MRAARRVATSPRMSLALTAQLLVASLAVMVVAGWRGSRPPDLVRGPRMVPWRFLMLITGALSVYLLIHLFRAWASG